MMPQRMNATLMAVFINELKRFSLSCDIQAYEELALYKINDCRKIAFSAFNWKKVLFFITMSPFRK